MPRLDYEREWIINKRHAINAFSRARPEKSFKGQVPVVQKPDEFQETVLPVDFMPVPSDAPLDPLDQIKIGNVRKIHARRHTKPLLQNRANVYLHELVLVVSTVILKLCCRQTTIVKASQKLPRSRSNFPDQVVSTLLCKIALSEFVKDGKIFSHFSYGG
jgi:hypothetical protein